MTAKYLRISKWGLLSILLFAQASCGDRLDSEKAAHTAEKASKQETDEQLPTKQPTLKPDSISIEDIISNRDNYELITPEPVWVNLELALRCNGVSPSALEKAVKDHGPHAFAQISISMNQLAADAFESKSGSYQEGAIILKSKSLGTMWNGSGSRSMHENVKDLESNEAIGGMVKRHDGYAPESGNWEYFYFENKSPVEHGLIQSCVDCHQKAKVTDFVFGNWSAPKDSDY